MSFILMLNENKDCYAYVTVQIKLLLAGKILGSECFIDFDALVVSKLAPSSLEEVFD